LKKEQIVIVDDDQDLLELLEYHLKNAGYKVFSFTSTKDVRTLLSQENIALIVMDRTLSDIDGIYYVEMLRNKKINTPVVFLSAKDSPKEIREGFLKGADDYITKPFDFEELILRIKAIIRRSKGVIKEDEESVTYGDIQIDLSLHKVYIGNRDIDLTKLEVRLLHTLLQNAGKVLTRDFLLENVWENSKHVQPKTVNVAIRRLKEKIDGESSESYIKTIRGVGYLMQKD